MSQLDIDTNLLQPPPAEDASMADVLKYYSLLREDLQRRIAEIEKFVGFVNSSEDLGTRLHKIENFLGVKV